MKTGKTVLFAVVLLLTVFIDSTFLKSWSWNGAHPDFVLVLLVFIAHSTGSRRAVVLGFAAGILMDILTLAPFGYYGLIYSTAGYLFGKTKNNVFLDPLLFPLILLFAASLLKILLSGIISSMYQPAKVGTAFSSAAFVELAMNMFLAPFILGFLKLSGLLKSHERDGY
jgi:rod shape-determining protein MreD